MIAARKSPRLAPIGEVPAYQAAIAELDQIAARLRQAEDRYRQALALGRGDAVGKRSVLDRGRALLAGARVASIDPGTEAAAAVDEIHALRELEHHATDRLNELVGDLSLRVCQEHEAEHSVALKAALRAMGDLFAAADAERQIRGRIVAAGYKVPSTILPEIVEPSVYRLGDPGSLGSEAGAYRRFLEMRGII
jgi:hypothetical protein